MQQQQTNMVSHWNGSFKTKVGQQPYANLLPWLSMLEVYEHVHVQCVLTMTVLYCIWALLYFTLLMQINVFDPDNCTCMVSLRIMWSLMLLFWSELFHTSTWRWDFKLRRLSTMAYVFRPEDLLKLDPQVDWGSSFKAWRAEWDMCTSLLGLAKQELVKQVQALTICFSRETVTKVDNLGLTAARQDVTRIVAAISQYVEGQINESVERHHFHQRRQQLGEFFDDFLVSLRELAKSCNFCTEKCTQKCNWDQIVEGL